MIRALLVLALLLHTTPAGAQSHGVILLYHHVSTTTPPSTSVTPERFTEHLDYLEAKGFTVIPLQEMLDAIYTGKAVAPNAVAITFDDAAESVFTRAWPQLQRRRMPFTVFVATEPVDNGYRGYMSWEQMRQLDAALASFGAHSVSHAHLWAREGAETDARWQARIRAEISGSVARIEEELGVAVRSFAYPYGEYDASVAEMVEAAGLYGITQTSGAVGSAVPAREVPRFPMAANYDDLARFATAVDARPLPVRRVGPDAVVVYPGDMPGEFHLQLDEGPYQRANLACYRGGPLALTPHDTGYRVALPTLRPGRNKVNCTAPSTERSGEFFWYSKLWLVADEAGLWQRE